MTSTAPTSPLVLKAQALEYKTTMVYGPLTVTPEGMFVIKGRNVTLNDAILAVGRYWKSKG